MKIVEFGNRAAVFFCCVVLVFFSLDAHSRDAAEVPCWKWTSGQSRTYRLTIERHQKAVADRKFTARLKVDAVLKLTARAVDSGTAVVDMGFDSLMIEQHAGKTHYIYDSKASIDLDNADNLWVVAGATLISSEFEFRQGADGKISDLCGFDENLDELLKRKRHVAEDTAFQVKRVFGNTEFVHILNGSFHILPSHAVSEGDSWVCNEDIYLGIGVTIRRNEKYVFEKKDCEGSAESMCVTMTGNMELLTENDGIVQLPGGSAHIKLGENSLSSETIFSSDFGAVVKQKREGLLKLKTVFSSEEDLPARVVQSDLSQIFKIELLP